MPGPHHPRAAGGPAEKAEHDAGPASLGDPLLTVDEVAAYLNVSRRWVYDSIRRGTLPAVRVGRYLRCTVAVVRAVPTPVDVTDFRSGRG